MARAKKTVTKDIKSVRELIRLTDEFEILNLCKSITHLKLDPMCIWIVRTRRNGMRITT